MRKYGWVAALSCMGLLFASGCVGPMAMTGSHQAPGARGTVKAVKGANNNTLIKLRVEHLAPAEEVVDHATAYVVWVQAIDHRTPATNVGELQVDKDLSGALETVTTLTSFDLSVTAQNSAQATIPQGQPLLSARVSRDP